MLRVFGACFVFLGSGLRLLPFCSIPSLPGPLSCLLLCSWCIWLGFVAAFLGGRPAQLLVLQAVSAVNAHGMAVLAHAVRIQYGYGARRAVMPHKLSYIGVLDLCTPVPGPFPYFRSLYPSCLCRGWVNGVQYCSVTQRTMRPRLQCLEYMCSVLCGYL